MMKTTLFTLILLLSMPLFGGKIAPKAAKTSKKAVKITKKNWKNHPKIVEIRKICQEIDQQLKKKQFTRKARKFPINPTYGNDVLREKYSDQSGKVRFYKTVFACEDGNSESLFFYDKNQTLRFYTTSGHVSETPADNGDGISYRSITRVYLNAKGKVIFHIVTEDTFFNKALKNNKYKKTKTKSITKVITDPKEQKNLVFDPDKDYLRKEYHNPGGEQHEVKECFSNAAHCGWH